MTRKRRPPLIAALAHLVVEYPEKDWRALGERLRDRKFIEELTVIVDVVSELSSKTRGRQKATKVASYRKILAQVAKEDEEKAELLNLFKSQLVSKTSPPSLSQIRDLATALGIKEHLPARREQAVNQLIRHLVSKSVDDIKTALHMGLPDHRDPGHEYGRWVDLILGSRSQIGEETKKAKNDETS